MKHVGFLTLEAWVNPSIRGGMNVVFQGLACQPEENPVHPDSFIWIYILFKMGHFGDIYDFQILMLEEA